MNSLVPLQSWERARFVSTTTFQMYLFLFSCRYHNPVFKDVKKLEVDYCYLLILFRDGSLQFSLTKYSFLFLVHNFLLWMNDRKCKNNFTEIIFHPSYSSLTIGENFDYFMLALPNLVTLSQFIPFNISKVFGILNKNTYDSVNSRLNFTELHLPLKNSACTRVICHDKNSIYYAV